MYNAIKGRICPGGHNLPTLAGTGALLQLSGVQEKFEDPRSRHILQSTLLASLWASYRFWATPEPHSTLTTQATEPDSGCGHSSRDVTGPGKCLLNKRPKEEAAPKSSNSQPNPRELLFFSTPPTFSNFTTKHEPLHNKMFMFERLKANHSFF